MNYACTIHIYEHVLTQQHLHGRFSANLDLRELGLFLLLWRNICKLDIKRPEAWQTEPERTAVITALPPLSGSLLVGSPHCQPGEAALRLLGGLKIYLCA